MAELLTAESRSFEGPGALEWTVLATCTLARSQAQAFDGVSSLAVTTTGTSGGPQSPLVAPTGAGIAVTARARIWTPNGGNFSINGIATGIGGNYSSTIMVPAATWTLLPIALPPGAASYRIWVRQSGGVVHTWYVDDASINDNAVAIPPPIQHTLENVMAGVKAALEGIVGLRVYDFPSDRVEPPAAVLSLPETPYDVTLGGRNDQWTFPLWVLVAKANDKSAYKEMVQYLEAEGTKSILAAIEADRTLGGACDTCSIIRARPLFATVAGTEFLAVEFTLEVYT